MIILDTDHITILQQDRAKAAEFQDRLKRSGVDDEICVSIVSYEEQFRGWLSFIARAGRTSELIFAYQKLERFHQFFSEWHLIPFDDASGFAFDHLRRQRLRIGTPDLKIAAIAIAHDALLLSANLRDFRRIPGLRVPELP
jgi:tRNA(fMet)-specific endonuclease VapC